MPDPGSITITNALIFDGRSAELIPGSVEVVDGRITGVGEITARPDARVIDARGRTVMPGLIDAHMHAFGTSLSALEIESWPLSYVHHGRLLQFRGESYRVKHALMK